MIQIENEDYTITINPMGAELSGICAKADCYAYLWQGDPAVWSGHSPLLFPIVGKLRNDTYTYQNKPYKIEKHGFARHELFAITSQSACQALLTFDNCQKHHAIYPFDYSLSVLFTLSGNRLTVCHQVRNRQQMPMYFSLGAHPGFCCGSGAYLEFEKRETVLAQRLDSNKIISPHRERFLTQENIFPLKADTFVDDAYLLEGVQSQYLWVRNPSSGRDVRVFFGGAPYLGIWSKPEAPYVCVEPWFGIDDDYQQSGAIEDKKGIVCLSSHQIFSFSYSVELY